MAPKTKAPSPRAMADATSHGRKKAAQLGRERIIQIQRTRLLSALFEVSAERGTGNVAVAHVVARAGVSRRTFYELFADREECFLAGFDEAVASASRYVLEGYDQHARWEVRLRAALIGFLSFLEIERGSGQLLVVGSLGAGSRTLGHRQRLLSQAIVVIDEGRDQTKAGKELPPLTAEGIVGGVLSVLHTRLLTDTGHEEGRESLLSLASPLMSMVVLPYLGPVAARKELARPAPKQRTVDRVAPGDPLRDMGTRLTYRTVRVLMSVAASPGASNREIGLGAGMEDQGQISKLLARLQRLELIHNARSAAARGAPNAWGLTEQGWRVQRAIAGQGAGG